LGVGGSVGIGSVSFVAVCVRAIDGMSVSSFSVGCGGNVYAILVDEVSSESIATL